jgi:Fuc2NAc and GlcNAc transferase
MSFFALNWQLIIAWIPVFIFVSVLSYFSCAVARRLAIQSGMITQPGERQSHQRATPTGGGLGLVFSLVVTTLLVQMFVPSARFWWQYILPGVLLLAAVGWLDDRTPVSSAIRLLVQLIAATWLMSFVWMTGSMQSIALSVLVIVALLWLMNLYNFMDGSNGMAAFQAVFVGLIMAGFFCLSGHTVMALFTLILVAACIGFLPLNFPYASVFMGDVASVPLGFVFGGLAVYGVYNDALSVEISLLLMAVFVVDATLTLLARVIRGERWYTAHNQHIYQRLIVHGWSHGRVLMVYQSINVLIILPAVMLAYIYPQYALEITGLTLLALGTSWYIAFRKLGACAARRLL